MTAVHRIKPEISAVQAPSFLAELPGWLCWRYEQHEGEPKPRKVPYYASGGRRHGVQGRPEDRSSLTTFAAAKSAAARRGMDGVGIAMLSDWGLVALDFDDCVDSAGVIAEVDRLLLGTYAEYSPSGNGVRAFMRGVTPNNKSHSTPTLYGFETFHSKGFVTFTGNVIESCELVEALDVALPLTDAVQTLCTARFGATRPQPTQEAAPGEATAADLTPPVGLSDAQLEAALDVLDPDMGRDDWLRVGMALHHETDGAGLPLWDAWSAGGSKYPGPDAVQQQWDSLGRSGREPVTARTLVKMANANGAHLDVTLAADADFEALGPAPEAKSEYSRFRVQPAHEFVDAPPMTWLVKHILPRAELVVMFGASGSGKSFAALDLVACIAQGLPWRDKKTAKGRVVYVAAEGAQGFRNRLRAYAHQHTIDLHQLDIGVVHAAPNLLDKADSVELAKAILADGRKADVVVIDTLAQTMPGGNENAGEDVGKVLAHCKRIHKATGAVILLIHHSGKDSAKGARGWSGLRGAMDAEIEVTREGDYRQIHISKQKDGEEGQVFGFKLHVVQIGIDEDGDAIASCTVEACDTQTPAIRNLKGKKAGPVMSAVLDAVSEMALAQNTGIEVEEVLKLALARLPAPTDGKRDTRKQHCRRALAELCSGEGAPFFEEGGCLSVLT